VEGRRLTTREFVGVLGRLVVTRRRGTPWPAIAQTIDRYGPAFCLRPARGWLPRRTSRTRKTSGIGEIWVVTDPEIIEALLIKEHRSFVKDPLTQELADVLGQGLLVSEGRSWKIDHALVQPAMTAVAMRRRVAAIAEVVDDALARWPARGDIDGMKMLGPVTLEVVARVVLGVSLADVAGEVGEALDEVLAYYGGAGAPGLRAPRSWRTPARRRFEAAVKRLREVTQILLARRAALPCDPDDPDALGRLLARHRERPDEVPWSRVHDQAITLMLAGNETTTTGLACSLRALADNPGAQARWHDEADAVEAGMLEPDDVPWIRAVWRESLRLHPPAPGVARIAKRDVTLAGLAVPARALVVVPTLAMHRRPQWFPDPDAFSPQRFLDPPTWPRLAYLPLGAGPRVCIGSHLADMEAFVVLAALGRRYGLSRPPGAKPLRLRSSVTMRPIDPVMVRLQPR
jgi:cytochrome P450